MGYVIMDTLDLELTRPNGDKVMSTTTTLGAISQTVTEERLKAGIGSGDIAVITSEQEQSVTVTDALFSKEYLELTQGATFAEGQVTVSKKATATVADNAGTLEGTIVGSSTGITSAYIVEGNETTPVTVTTGKFTVPTGVGAVAGDVLNIVYEQEITGEVLEFDLTKQSENLKCQLSTIMYDPETMKVVKNIYIQYDNVKASKAFDLSFEMGSPIAPELTLMVLKSKGSNSIGRVIFEDVV